MRTPQPATNRWRKILRIVFYILGCLLLLVISAVYALSVPAVQQRITKEAESYLQEKLATRVEVGAVRLRFPYHISLENFLLEDQQQDTLLRVGSLVIAVDMWKLLDQTIELQQLKLENAVVYLHRKDSAYNFDFILRAFSNPEAVPSADTSASPWKLQADFAKVRLQQVHFLLDDEDTAATTAAEIGLAEALIAKADLENMYFELDQLSLTDADIRLVQKKKSVASGEPSPAFEILLKNGLISRSHIIYSVPQMGLEVNLEKSHLDNFQIKSTNKGLAIQAKNFKTKNSTLAYRDPATPLTPGHLNAGDLDLTRLNADLSGFSFQNDSIFVQANALSGADKTGLDLHRLQATAHITPGSIEIKNVFASLNQTRLNGDILLLNNRAGVLDRMQVQMRQLKGVVGDLIALLPPQDIPALAQLSDMPYELSGNLNGWLENLQTEQIKFRAGSGSFAFFDGSLQQLTKPSQLGMQLTGSRLETNRADLIRFMSVAGIPRDSILALPLPAHFSASGTLNGNMSSMQVSLKGEAGALQTDSVLALVNKLPLHFDIAGTLTQLSNPDSLGMDLQINRLEAPQNFFAFLEPQGLRLPDLLQANGSLRGTLSALNIDLQIKALRGETSSRLNFKGLLKNLSKLDQLDFDLNFDAALARREIQAYVPDSVLSQVLRLPDFVQIKGAARGAVKDAVGNLQIRFDDWGQVRLDGTLRDSSYQLNLVAQNIQVSQLVADTSLRPLKTIGFKARIDGEGFQFGSSACVRLAGAFDSLIWNDLILRDIALDADVKGKSFAATLQSPDERAAVFAQVSGDFSTAIPLLETNITVNCLDLRAFGWSSRPAHICMQIVSHSEGLSLDTLVAQVTAKGIDLQYDTVHVRPGDLTLDLNFDNRHNQITMNSDWLQGEIKGYFSLADLPTTVADIAEQYFVMDRTEYVPPVGTDSLSVRLNLLQSEVFTTGMIPGLFELGPMQLEGALVAQRNYFNLLLSTPRIVYQDWDVAALHVRAYAGDTAALFELTTPLVKKGAQDFIENAELNGRFLANIADVSFKSSNGEGRDRFLLALQATMNNASKETVVRLSQRQLIDFKEWSVDADNKIRIAPAGVEVRNMTMTGNGQSIQVEGATRNLPDNKTGLDFAVDIDRLNYNNFDIFVADVLKELGGWAEAHLTIKGRTDDLQLRGTMQLHETFFRPALTNVRYELSETPLEFTQTGLSLDGLSLRDPAGKILKINGALNTSDWANIQTNLTLHADRWQVMNSTRQQNPLYFGEVYVSLDGTVRGPISLPDLQLSVRTAKESSFTYVYDVATQNLQHEGVVVFLPPPQQYVRPQVHNTQAYSQPFTLSASIEIDSNLTINSVIDPVTGDDFKGKATGKLQLDMLSNGTMTLAGRVELVRGVYNYSYQSIVKRRFDVRAGSSITWTGDPYLPELDIKAEYQFKASPYPLVVNQLSSASAEELANYRQAQAFILQTSVLGSVMEPDVSFQFTLPSAERQGAFSTSFGNQQSGLVESALNNINEDKNLLSQQVFGVLLMRNFVGGSGGSIAGNPLQSGLNNFLTSQLNALADQYLSWIDVDLSTTEGSSNTNSAQAAGSTGYQLRLQKSFFDDRLTFRISGGATVGGSNGEEASSALENASVEYALTPNGALKVTVFSENGFKLLNASSANLRNSGAGLIFTKEFGKK